MIQLGSLPIERYEQVHDDGGKAAGRRHIGWRWRCECSSFSRPEGDYLWVPCAGHQGALA